MATYRNACRVCGGPLHVIAGKFLTPHMPLTRGGFSFTEAKQISTEDEEVHCATCDTELPLANYTVSCSDCDDTGWGHFEGNHGREIQRCDCGKFATDDDAKAAHKADCGCGWGTRWYRHLYEVTVKVIVAAPPGQAIEVERNLACHVQGHLPGLASDLHGGGLMNVCSARTAGTEVDDEHPSRRLLVELGVLDDG